MAAVAYDQAPVLLLVPAMPDAGRTTAGGVHYVDDGRGRRPVASTAYAEDPRLGYQNSHLLRWAEERSGGALRASQGSVVLLGDLRVSGADAVCDAPTTLSKKGHALVCVVDAETHDDLRVVARGGVLHHMATLPSVVIAKGGITSATVASTGLDARTAWVEGPAMTGVAIWRVGDGDTATRLLVVPGNVGSDDLLVDLVARVAVDRTLGGDRQ